MLLALTTAIAHAHETSLPHLDLEMTSAEYAELLRKQDNDKLFGRGKNQDATIESTIKLGTRLSTWIALINANRTPDAAIRLSSATNRGNGISIDEPNMYSPSIIAKDLSNTLKDAPEGLKEVLTGNGDLPTTTGMDDETFIKHARLIDRIYQSAARYKSVDQYRSAYVNAANRDVRGYYYFKKNKIGAADLSNLDQFSATQIKEITTALVRMCLNDGVGSIVVAKSYTKKECEKLVKEGKKKNNLSNVYDRFHWSAKRNWESFFEIPEYRNRSDVTWTDKEAIVPFNTPAIPKFIPYLQNNIEDEFRWGDRALKLQFGKFQNGPQIQFKAGVVPHVDGLGGNNIVMDLNMPIEEYASQWTIRHEFGHVLGLPDCYHEFYDEEEEAYVNYQLDTTDLMCSRAGNMNERIYNELKKAYTRKTL